MLRNPPEGLLSTPSSPREACRTPQEASRSPPDNPRSPDRRFQTPPPRAPQGAPRAPPGLPPQDALGISQNSCVSYGVMFKFIPEKFRGVSQNLTHIVRTPLVLGGETGGLSWGSRRALGAFWRLLGASWGLLGPSWAVLGASWAILGGSWGVLGAPWSPPGPSRPPLQDPPGAPRLPWR